jgi:hypothetical protein
MCDAIPDNLYTKEQRDYVDSVKPENYKDIILHYMRMRDNITKDRNSFEQKTYKLEKEQSKLKDMLETAWGIIANAGGGNWDLESDEWQEASKKWRDQYHEIKTV